MSVRKTSLTGVTIVLALMGWTLVFISYTSKKYTPYDQIDLHQMFLQQAEYYRKQRNMLSYMLNTVKQELAISSCEMRDLKVQFNMSTYPVSTTGGWCRRESYSAYGVHMFDQTLARELSLFFQNQSVVSFGDGPGDYKRFIDSTKRLIVYDAYDGSPYALEASGGAVKHLDLTAPHYGLPVYNWVMSLEVAEHIPSKYESIYVDNLVRHARHGIVLSWAVPDQGGHSHVNEKPLTYVQDLFNRRGFDPDLNASMTIRTKATFHWFQRNLYVFRRRKQSTIRLEDA